MKNRLIVMGLGLLVLTTGCWKRAEPITIVSQLAKFSDLSVFCRPSLGVSDMISTYDRRGGNIDWWDFPKPFDGKELYEVAFLKGPGCVTRIWNTNIRTTEWMFYFDGESEARLRLKPEELFFSEKKELSPLCGSVSGGAHAYFPFPYEKSLRVVIRVPGRKEDDRPYFHLNYETYPKGTRVRSFPKPYAPLAEMAASCNARLRQASQETDTVFRRLNGWQSRNLEAGRATELATFGGAGIINTFALRPHLDAFNGANRVFLLRSLMLEMYWDGQSVPSVQVPMGDFFCNGKARRDFSSLPMAVQDGVYLCRLPMPFRKGCRVVIRNDSSAPVVCDFATEITYGNPGDGLYLHASFNASTSSGTPFRMMKTSGAGKYVGCYLLALGMDGGWNILEGDESFYRDGSKTPSHRGTGLEDYFNGGWYYYGLFELPFHGLLEKAAMRTAQFRFHPSDPVTFTESLRMEMEFGDANRAGGYLSAAAYWYQKKPGPSNSTLPTDANRFPPLDKVGLATIMVELFELERVGLIANAIERCDFYASVLAKYPERHLFQLRGAAYRELLQGYPAVRETYAQIASLTNAPAEIVQQAKLLLWRGEKPGRGIYGVHSFGDSKLFVDGKQIGQGGHPQIWNAYPVELTPGEHRLEAEILPNHDYSFLSLGYSSFTTNIVSDVSWDYLAKDGAWKPYEQGGNMFPTMAFWQFVPNAFVCVQSAWQHGGPYPGWAGERTRPIRVGRRLVVPELTSADRPPLPPRVMMFAAPAVRPKEDTSNEGLRHHE